MFTIAAYSQSQDAGGAEVTMDAVPDQHLRTVGDDIIVPDTYRWLMGGFACIGTNGLYALFVAPSLRRINPTYVQPAMGVITPAGDIVHSVDNKGLIELEPDESLSVAYFGTPGGAEQASIVAWLSDSQIAEVDGKITTIRCTCTQTLVAGLWHASNITLVDDLPVGVYDVVGMQVVADEMVAARLIFVGSTNRPGCPGIHAVGIGGGEMFRKGKLGVWGSFHTTVIPMIELLGSAAEASDTYNIFLDVIKRS